MVDVLVQVLAPCLPFLLGLGKKAVEKGAEKAGEKTVEGLMPKAQKLWERLRPKVEAKAAAQEAVAEVAANPEDGDLQAVLRVQLKKILESDPELAATIAQILEEEDGSGAVQVRQQVTGNQNQVIGVMQQGSKAIGSVGSVQGDVNQ
jgi:SRSO17 transposase